MNLKFIYIFFLLFLLFSCKEKDKTRLVESAKDLQKKEIIFSKIEKGWVFNAKPINAVSQENTKNWKAWGELLTELDQKPKKTIGAFQKKATELSKKAMNLNSAIPIDFDKPQIKSRISVLITKVKMLDLFIHLSNIPDKKVIVLVGEINTELISLQNQMQKIVQKNKIPLEKGESELLKILDAARAIPNSPSPIVDPNSPRVE